MSLSSNSNSDDETGFESDDEERARTKKLRSDAQIRIDHENKFFNSKLFGNYNINYFFKRTEKLYFQIRDLRELIAQQRLEINEIKKGRSI